MKQISFCPLNIRHVRLLHHKWLILPNSYQKNYKDTLERRHMTKANELLMVHDSFAINCPTNTVAIRSQSNIKTTTHLPLLVTCTTPESLSETHCPFQN
eukprot:c24282_g1_i1 orf=401-697(-)